MKILLITPDFEWLATQVANPTQFTQAYRRYRRAQFKSLMSQGVDPYGNRYVPLSRRYAMAKRAQWGAQPILTASGKMRRSYKTRLIGGVVVESVDSPAEYHQAGTGDLPQRLVLPSADQGMPEKDLIEVGAIGRRYIKRLTKKAPTKTFTFGR